MGKAQINNTTGVVKITKRDKLIKNRSLFLKELIFVGNCKGIVQSPIGFV